jgi:hypothetical protein
MFVFDSLKTDRWTKNKCVRLAIAFGLKKNDVEYCDMVFQTEDPPRYCAIFVLALANGLRQGVVPVLVRAVICSTSFKTHSRCLQQGDNDQYFASSATQSVFRRFFANSMNSSELDKGLIFAKDGATSSPSLIEVDRIAVEQFWKPFTVRRLFLEPSLDTLFFFRMTLS